MREIIGVYPGIFDPITNGHEDIIKRASSITDKLILAISENINKKPIFSIDERYDMACAYIKKTGAPDNIEVMQFTGLLAEFVKKVNAKFIIRGIRAISDFEYEFQMSCMNSRLNNSIETIFLPASEKHQFLSSKLVKEIASMGGTVKDFVMPEIEQKLIKYYDKNYL